MKGTTKHLIAELTAFVIVAAASLVLAGWLFNIPSFKSVLPGSVTMKFNTALCFIFCGIHLLLINRPPLNNTRKRAALLCALIVLLIAGLTLTEYLTGWNAGIDELLWTEGPGAVATSMPGRMSMSTALNFTLLSLVLLSLRNTRYHLLTQVVLVFIAAGSVLVILNHTFGTSFLSSIPQLSNTALHTAILFIVLCTGIMYSTPLQYLKFSFQKKIAAFFVLTILLLAFVFYAMDKNIVNTENTAQWVEHTNLVLLETERVFSETRDIESAVRGFVITGSEDYLALFTSAVAHINSSVEKLKDLTKDNPRQQPRIDSLRQLITQNIAMRQSVINILKNGNREAAIKIIQSGADKKITAEINRIISIIQLEEEGLLTARKTENEKSHRNSVRIITLLQILAVLLLVITFRIIYNNIRARNKAESALKASLTEISNFKTLFESTPGLYLILRPDFTIEAVSDEYLKATMTRREAILGRGLFEVFPDNPDDPAADGVSNLKASLHFVLANKVAHEMANQKYDIARPDGSFEERTWAPLNKPVLDANGEIVYIIHSVDDITVRLQNEKELIRKTNEIKDLYNNAPCGYHSVDAEGVLIEINNTELQWLGYTREEVVGKLKFTDIISPESKTSFLENFSEFKKQGYIKDLEFDLVRKDGTYMPVMLSASAIYDEQGNFLRSRSTVMDYAEQKLLYEKLRSFNKELEEKVNEKTKEVIAKEQQYRFLLQNMQEGIQVIGHDWRYLFVNNSVVKQSKYLREELLGHTMMEKYPGIENTALFRILQQCMKERTSQLFENEFTFPDGTKEWYELRIQPVPEGLFILSMDITERKKAEETIRRLYQAIEQTDEIVFTTDTDGIINFMNAAFEEVYGYKKEEVVGKKTPRILKSGIVDPRFYEEIWEKLPGGKSLHREIINKTKNGRLITVDTSLNPIFDEQRKLVGYMAVQEDITEKKMAQKKLYDAELQYRTLFEQSPDGICVIDAETLLPIDFNKTIHTQLGYSPEEFIRLKVSDYEITDSPETIKTRTEKIMREGQHSFETMHKTKNGEIREVQATVLKITLHGRPLFYTIFRDVTERRKLEKELAEQQLRQQKLITETTIQAQEKERQELGRELHDNINQILATVKMYLGMAKVKKNSSSNLVSQSYEYVNEAIEEIRKLSHSLVAPSLGDMGLQEALRELAEEINKSTGLEVQLVNETDKGLALDDKKELMLYRIVQEQMNNIRKYAQAKTAIITLKTEENSLHLSIADDGVGFDSTKKAKGIGLKNIGSRVEFYSGNMQITTSPGQGCKLEITIPL